MMKSPFQAVRWSAVALALLWVAGCQQANNPVNAPQTQASAEKSSSVGGPTCSCSQTCSPTSAPPGASVTYSIALNISGGTATACQITDVLPAGLSYVQGTASTLAGGTFTCVGSTLTWVYAAVGPCTCVMNYVAQVGNSASLVGSTLANTEVMTCSLLSAAVSSTANLLVTAATPTLVPTVVIPTPTPTFTPVPPTPTNTFTPVPPTATYTFTPVPPTATYTYTFTNTYTPVPPTNTPTFTSTPTNSFTPAPPPPTNTPIPIPTISLSQSCAPVSAALGAAVTYTLNLGVTGCSCSANNVTIQDVLPTGLSYVQGTATTIAGGTFSASGQTLTWVYNSVGPCTCTMTYVTQVSDSLTNLVGSTLQNSAVLSCSSLASSLTATADCLITGLLGL